MEMNLGQLFLRGGWVMWPLLIFSVLCWAVILERTFMFVTLRPKLSRLIQALHQATQSGDHVAARQLCHHQHPQISELFLATLEPKLNREKAERIVERGRVRLAGYFRKNLWVLGTIGSASPFIGLLGTVIGIVRAFHDMAEKGAGGFSVVAAGISEALVATAAGLIVAIISLLAYNVFVTAANQTTSFIKLSVEELLDTNREVAKA